MIDLYGRLIALVLSFFICTFIFSRFDFLAISLRSITKFRLKIYTLYFLSFCSPLVVIHFSNYFKGQFDRVYLSQYYSAVDVGVYSLGYQIASIYLILLTSLIRSIQPNIYKSIKDNKLDYTGVLIYSLKAFFISVLIPIIALLVPESLYLWFFGSEFANVKLICVLFLFAFGFQSSFFIQSIYLSFYAKTKVLMFIGGSTLLIYLTLLHALSGTDISNVPLATMISNMLALVFITMFVFFGRNDERKN